MRACKCLFVLKVLATNYSIHPEIMPTAPISVIPNHDFLYFFYIYYRSYVIYILQNIYKYYIFIYTNNFEKSTNHLLKIPLFKRNRESKTLFNWPKVRAPHFNNHIFSALLRCFYSSG